jgi:hypothetical protein
MRNFEVVDRSPPDSRPPTRWRKPMAESPKAPAERSGTDRSSKAEAKAVRARLLRMIVHNEEARKPKPQ